MVSNSILEVCLLGSAVQTMIGRKRKELIIIEEGGKIYIYRFDLINKLEKQNVKIELKTSEGQVPRTFERNSDQVFLIKDAEFALSSLAP